MRPFLGESQLGNLLDARCLAYSVESKRSPELPSNFFAVKLGRLKLILLNIAFEKQWQAANKPPSPKPGLNYQRLCSLSVYLVSQAYYRVEDHQEKSTTSATVADILQGKKDECNGENPETAVPEEERPGPSILGIPTTAAEVKNNSKPDATGSNPFSSHDFDVGIPLLSLMYFPLLRGCLFM